MSSREHSAGPIQENEEKRPSYLDIVKESVKNKPYMTYRCIICGELGKEVDRVEYSSH